jgi:hypothetical protein
MGMEHQELSALENVYESNKQLYMELMGLESEEELNGFDIDLLEKTTNNGR